ncbi:MAG: phosphoribosyltransferase [Candidatus Anstonellaceae archaeon]
MYNNSNNLNLQDYTVVLVSRGGISPPYLSWWRKISKKIHVLDFSRWRWFAYNKEPQWIYPPYPPKDKNLIIFDRSISTGMTMKFLKNYLTNKGYNVVCIGVLDKKFGLLGHKFLDYIWDNGQIIKADDFQNDAKFNYTIAVVEKTIPFLDGLNYEPDFLSLQENPLDNIVNKDKSIVIQKVPTWIEGMLISYIVEKPLILVAPPEQVNIPVDLNTDEEINLIYSYLQKEK